MGNQTGLTMFDYPYLYCKPTQFDIFTILIRIAVSTLTLQVVENNLADTH